jgi:hypothetical protein
MTRALQELIDEGYPVTEEIIARLAPYRTDHINRSEVRSGTRANRRGFTTVVARSTRILYFSLPYPNLGALMSRFDKLWTEDCVQWRTDVRGVRIIWSYYRSLY